MDLVFITWTPFYNCEIRIYLDTTSITRELSTKKYPEVAHGLARGLNPDEQAIGNASMIKYPQEHTDPAAESIE